MPHTEEVAHSHSSLLTPSANTLLPPFSFSSLPVSPIPHSPLILARARLLPLFSYGSLNSLHSLWVSTVSGIIIWAEGNGASSSRGFWSALICCLPLQNYSAVKLKHLLTSLLGSGAGWPPGRRSRELSAAWAALLFTPALTGHSHQSWHSRLAGIL